MTTECQVCKSSSIRTYGEQHWHIGGAQYGLSRCDACGCVFTDPMPGDATLAEFYKTAFCYDWYLDYFGAKLLDCQMRVEEYGDLLGKRVLDYGGGLGYFSLVARLRGHESMTYDPYTNSGTPEKGAWDSVAALHVLEHSNQPDRMLLHIREFLRPGGKVILAVPNFEGHGYAKVGMGWVWAQPPMLHLFHFTELGLRQLMERNGFRVEGVSFHERWDANLIMDVEQVDRIRKLEMEWHDENVRPFPQKRAFVAWRNSQIRFEGLQQALQNSSPHGRDCAELQIVASCC